MSSLSCCHCAVAAPLTKTKESGEFSAELGKFVEQGISGCADVGVHKAFAFAALIYKLHHCSLVVASIGHST